MAEDEPTTATAELPKARRRLLLAAKLLVAALAIAFILSRQSWPALRAALLALSPWALLTAAALHASGYLVGTVRWRALMRAYGGQPQSFAAMLRSYAIGDFYNTYVPGGVGGDLLRGVITRRAFAHGGGAPAAFAVVLVERCLGLAAVLSLTILASSLQPESKLAGALLPFCWLGIAAIAALVIAISQGRYLARLAPAALRPTLASLPRLQSAGPFVLGYLLSLGTQSLEVLCGHVLIASISHDVTLTDSFLTLPLAMAAGFLPLSVAGIGPRDVALVTLYELAGVQRAHATATALGYSLVTLWVASLGGILQLFAPVGADTTRWGRRRPGSTATGK